MRPLRFRNIRQRHYGIGRARVAPGRIAAENQMVCAEAGGERLYDNAMAENLFKTECIYAISLPLSARPMR